MIERSSDGSEFSRGYQQALDDFGISQLLSKIRTYSDADFDAQWMRLKQKELNSLAVHFITQLTANLQGSLIASYLKTLRKANVRHSSNRQSIPLPENLPPSIETPDSLAADYSKPWAIVQILPGAQNQIIGRFCNRQDADDRARALRKFVRSGIFEVVFDRPQ
jgi:hypothetical protein